MKKSSIILFAHILLIPIIIILLLYFQKVSFTTSIKTNIIETPTNQVANTGIVEVSRIYANSKSHIPFLWKSIENKNISFYPEIWISDAIVNQNELWIVGKFGVIRRGKDGVSNWYNILNGLQINDINVVTVSPINQVWIGGANNSLFIYSDGIWIEKGLNIPNEFDNGNGYLCHSSDIYDIDFTSDGSVWILNGGVDVFQYKNNSWKNYNVPKELLPWAGGGGCPMGFSVASQTDITVKIGGCCSEPPMAIHYDGNNWNKSEDYSSITLKENKKYKMGKADYINEMYKSIWDILPFDKKIILPTDPYDQITTDTNGNIWLGWDFGYELVSNTTGIFQLETKQGQNDEAPDYEKSRFIIFRNEPAFISSSGKVDPLYYLLFDIGYRYHDQIFSKDEYNRAWVYDNNLGILSIDKGKIFKHGIIPFEYNEKEYGGTYNQTDNIIYIGGKSKIWKRNNTSWKLIYISDIEQLITDVIEIEQGNIIFATNEGVYQLLENEVKGSVFVHNYHKPINSVLNNQPCVYYKNYIVGSINGCIYSADVESIDYSFRSLYLGIDKNKNIIYINNHIIARYDGKEWKSFYFDNMEIITGTMDNDGNIWIYLKNGGLIKINQIGFS